MKRFSDKNKARVKKSLLGAALVLLLSLIALVAFSVTEDCVGKYSFVNKRFACFEKHIVNKKSYSELRSQLMGYINEEKEAGNVDIVSIFFRDLEAGPTMGINERIDFVPASLLKLPNALVLLRLHEDGELDIDEEKLLYIGQPETESANNSDGEIKPNVSVSPSLISLSDIIFKSLAYSDNSANSLLLRYIEAIDAGRNLFLEIDRDLGIIETNDTTTAIVNAKGYGAIFRMLYNSSFLNPENSERLLEIMSHSLDTAGLAAGVPKGVKVAHKFGQRILGEDNNQLHDCGIVYYPQNPYLLCIMTRGRDVKKLQEVITAISAKVYKEFDSRRLE